MKRRYDFEELGRRYGFDPRHVEEVCRISDLLEDLSNVLFLRDRLCLYGGTALAFVFFHEIRRLSIDVDFNYRHLDVEDWGSVREEIDERIKKLLYVQGYTASNLAISASYPLGRITVQYRNHQGLRDNFMIEIGYMRRIPILREDFVGMFRHIGTGERFPIKTPMPEELFANKWCTFLYRGSSRDLFDVYLISKENMNHEVFRKCAIVDSLMRNLPKLHKIDVEELVDSIPFDSGLKNLLSIGVGRDDFTLLRQEVLNFSEQVLSDLTCDEKEAIELFYGEYKFKQNLIDEHMIFNEKIQFHPMIQRALDILKMKKPP